MYITVIGGKIQVYLLVISLYNSPVMYYIMDVIDSSYQVSHLIQKSEETKASSLRCLAGYKPDLVNKLFPVPLECGLYETHVSLGASLLGSSSILGANHIMFIPWLHACD